jgi:hypothetical protein
MILKIAFVQSQIGQYLLITSFKENIHFYLAEETPLIRRATDSFFPILLFHLNRPGQTGLWMAFMKLFFKYWFGPLKPIIIFTIASN